MASIQAGLHSVREILDAASFNLEEKAAADYLDGAVDHRRVKVGGLGFDSADKTIRIPVTADEVEITLDGKKEATLSVDLDEEQKRERSRTLAFAVDDSRHDPELAEKLSSPEGADKELRAARI
jgi:hypothetical protein